MPNAKGQNQHFKQLVSDAPGEVLAALGEALLCLDMQRRGESEEAPARLREAFLLLARHLTAAGRELNLEQQLFLLSGAIAPEVSLRDHDGTAITIELLPAELYDFMLGSIEGWHSSEWRPEFILDAEARIECTAGGLLKPYDPLRPGRYRPPSQKSNQLSEPQAREQAQRAVARARASLDDALKRFAASLSAEKLTPILRSVKELSLVAEQLLDGASMPTAQRLREISMGPRLRQLGRSVDDSALALSRYEEELLTAIAAMSALTRSSALAAAVVSGRSSASFDISLAERDLLRMHEMLAGRERVEHKAAVWQQSRILISEQFSELEGDPRERLALPMQLASAILRIDKLHPNLFPHDADGRPLLPPIVIEAAAGHLHWLDDRFCLGFVSAEAARSGPQESFNPLECTVLRLYGQFLASGDIFNYRGEKARDSFIADYSVAEENRAVVRFVGAEKRMTYGSSTEVKDSASREDAERDYADFMFTVLNNLPLPRRVNPRRVGVLMRYCLVRDKELSAQIVLRHIAPADQLLARDLITRLGGRNSLRILELVQSAMEADPQIAAQHRRDPMQALEYVMGREFVKELRAAAEAQVSASPNGMVLSTARQPSGHDYFDI